jgi:shikimate dehydrogenase
VPHKIRAAQLADELDTTARRSEAVNTIVKRDARLVGYNTDGSGFVASLRNDAAFDLAGKSCAVLGAGGAARSIACAMVDARAGSVSIINRTPSRASECAAIAGLPAKVGVMHDMYEADVIVNATSVGITGEDHDFLRLVVGHIEPRHLVVDIVYRPLDTPLLLAARDRGAHVLDGLSMLVHQAAASFELWTGQAAPTSTMRAAAIAALAP